MQLENHLKRVHLFSFKVFLLLSLPLPLRAFRLEGGLRDHPVGPPPGVRSHGQKAAEQTPPHPLQPPPTHKDSCRKHRLPPAHPHANSLRATDYLCVTICSPGSSKFSSLVCGCRTSRKGSPHSHSPAQNQKTRDRIRAQSRSAPSTKGTPFPLLLQESHFLQWTGGFL